MQPGCMQPKCNRVACVKKIWLLSIAFQIQPNTQFLDIFLFLMQFGCFWLHLESNRTVFTHATRLHFGCMQPGCMCNWPEIAGVASKKTANFTNGTARA